MLARMPTTDALNRQRRPRVFPLSLVLALALLAACAHDGRALRDPAPGATTLPQPPTTLSVTTVPGKDDAVIGPVSVVAPLVLTSPAFAAGQPLPSTASCDDPAPVSPPLAWTNVPSGAAELAVTFIDTDANGLIHWAVAGIAPTVRALDASLLPDGAVALVNDRGQAGWLPACPPRGGPLHHYVFTVYALNQATGLAPGGGARESLAALTANALGIATLTGTYQR